ncbi:MAG: prolipoprotein diacylglyceryl transferase [Bryobacterales bacterium]|nr:prolipoprotein diacylglyceryl transferase [Bryobacterales bacterium]
MLFAGLVALGVVLAHAVVLRRAGVLRLRTAAVNQMVGAALAAGFLTAYLVKFLYNPAGLAGNPAALLANSTGISSFGGIVGGLLGALAALRGARPSPLAYLDALAFAFPFGWILGRTGCVLVKDHPGLPASGPFARDFAGILRYDLALIELLAFALPITLLFSWLARRPRRSGFFLSTFLITYGPFRLLLDALHDQPPRYGPLTVDQWFGLLLTAAGLAFFRSLPPAAQTPPAAATTAPERLSARH